MLKKCGFSILEVMLGVALMASLGLGIYRLQLAELMAAQQLLTRQYLFQAANNIASQIYANLNYSQANSLSRSAAVYAETSFSEHSLLAPINCASSWCSARQSAGYTLYHWKQALSNFNLPRANIAAIVCQDSSFQPPTTTRPNCNGQGGLVVKIAWQAQNNPSEEVFLPSANYILLQVPQR